MYLLKTMGAGFDVFTWAYRSQVLSASLREFYALTFGAYDLIVGFEMPASLLRYCGEVGIKAIDIAIHPYRFLDDLVLMARSSDSATEAAIEAIQHSFANDVAIPPMPREAIGKTRRELEQLRNNTANDFSLF